jgi:hypothetical protein
MKKIFAVFCLLSLSFTVHAAELPPKDVQNLEIGVFSVINAYSGLLLTQVTTHATVVAGSKTGVLLLRSALAVGTGLGYTGAVTGAFGAGYYVGTLLVRGDQAYLNGTIVDSTGKVLAPLFSGIYNIQSSIEK